MNVYIQEQYHLLSTGGKATHIPSSNSNCIRRPGWEADVYWQNFIGWLGIFHLFRRVAFGSFQRSFLRPLIFNF